MQRHQWQQREAVPVSSRTLNSSRRGFKTRLEAVKGISAFDGWITSHIFWSNFNETFMPLTFYPAHLKGALLACDPLFGLRNGSFSGRERGGKNNFCLDLDGNMFKIYWNLKRVSLLWWRRVMAVVRHQGDKYYTDKILRNGLWLT